MSAHQPGSTPIDIPKRSRTPPILPHPRLRLRRSGRQPKCREKVPEKDNRPQVIRAFFFPP